MLFGFSPIRGIAPAREIEDLGAVWQLMGAAADEEIGPPPTLVGRPRIPRIFAPPPVLLRSCATEHGWSYQCRSGCWRSATTAPFGCAFGGDLGDQRLDIDLGTAPV